LVLRNGQGKKDQQNQQPSQQATQLPPIQHLPHRFPVHSADRQLSFENFDGVVIEGVDFV